MEKYKLCPACGHRNHPLFLECSECEADLQTVPVTDEEMERQEARNDQPSTEQPTGNVMVRLCDCGERNPVRNRRCSACGEDISMMAPVPDTAPVADRYLLSSLDGSYAYEIAEGTTVIGREHEMREYLVSRPYVSRRHAELTLDTASGILTVRNSSTTNYTFVNNERISSDVPVTLKDGDEIGLGGNEQNGSRQDQAAYFTVRIGPCT